MRTDKQNAAMHASSVTRAADTMTAMVQAEYGEAEDVLRLEQIDVAGRVESAGPNVTGLKVGDEVFGVAPGSFAQYACAAADKRVTKPKRLTFEQAAAIPVSACTALQDVRDRGRVRPGQQVLVTGASGGVDTFAVQIAKAYGAEVTGVCSTSKLDLVRSTGADHVMDYTRGDVADGR